MKRAKLSYGTAQMANQLIDMMPSGPKWTAVRFEVPGYQTAEPIIMYMRNTEACVEYLLNNPLFSDRMNFVPVKHFTADGKRVFSETVSAFQAWETQVRASLKQVV